MAGSYRHCCKDDGSFIGDDFQDMICDLGDAYEACEEMHWLINYLAGGKQKVIEQALYAYLHRIGAIVSWTTVGGDEYSGRIIDLDSNVAVVKCDDGEIRMLEI